MNTKNLIRFLKNDLIELTDILSEIKLGSSFSEIEIKLIKSRIRSLTEEFEILESTVGNIAVASERKELEYNQPTKKNDSLEINLVDNASLQQSSKTELLGRQSEPRVEQSIEEKESVENIQQENVEKEDVVQKEKKPKESSDVPPSKLINLPIEHDVPSDMEELAEQFESKFEIKEEIQENIVSESNHRQTIAEKYNGSSDSFNDRMAAHIIQQDLASKLKEHPIDDLNKAIKLNDKVWFIKELFDGNPDLYKQTIDAINKMSDMDEALSFIQANFSFDQDKSSFKSFIEFVYRRFLK